MNQEKRLGILGLPAGASPEAVAEKAHDLRFALGIEPLEYAEHVRLTEEGRIIGPSAPITLPYGPTLLLKPHKRVTIPSDEIAALIESATTAGTGNKYEQRLDREVDFRDLIEGKDSDEIAALSGEYPNAYERHRQRVVKGEYE